MHQKISEVYQSCYVSVLVLVLARAHLVATLVSSICLRPSIGGFHRGKSQHIGNQHQRASEPSQVCSKWPGKRIVSCNGCKLKYIEGSWPLLGSKISRVEEIEISMTQGLHQRFFLALHAGPALSPAIHVSPTTSFIYQPLVAPNKNLRPFTSGKPPI